MEIGASTVKIGETRQVNRVRLGGGEPISSLLIKTDQATRLEVGSENPPNLEK